MAARLSGDPRFEAIRITSLNGVVYLTGTVDSAATGARATQIAQGAAGAREVVNQLQLASSSPSSTVVSAPMPTVVTVVTPPAAPAAAGMGVVPGQPPVDVHGVVRAYDPQTRIVTFDDGRVVRVHPGSIWQRVPGDAIQPGRHIYARNAEPLTIQSSVPASQAGSWRFGTVERVDVANGELYLNNGDVVAVNPSTPLTMNGQPMTLAQIRPGAQIAVRMPETTTIGQTQSAASGSALPRSVIAPPAATQILIYP